MFVSGVLFTTAGANFLGSEDRVATISLASDRAEIEPTMDWTEPDVAPSVFEFESAFVNVAERINPAVVQIRAERVVRQQMPDASQLRGTPFDDFFRQFGLPQAERGTPGGGTQREYRSEGLGSGVIIRGDGYIVTNNHVVDGAENFSVMLLDGSELEATLVGGDEFTDLAVLKVETDDLPVVGFGNADDLRVGQWVMAFGSPLSAELANTVTTGIVSAKGRYSSNGTSVQHYIQTDAAINPGNSGGALINLNGELVGINTAIFTRTGGYQGIGFAIPVNTVEAITGQLIAKGGVQRARLGVEYGAASNALINALDLPLGAAQVGNVIEGSAADKAGIHEGDVILEVDGQKLDNALALSTIIGGLRPGQKIDMKINREGEQKTLTVTLGAAEESESVAAVEDTSEDSVSEALGLSYTSLTEDVARRYNIESDLNGVLITDVDESSLAFRDANLRPGFLIIEANRQKVESVKDFEKIVESLDEGDSFLVRVRILENDSSMLTALVK